ncbi:MAG: hypothetical protein KDK26_13495 [Roseivivax sp.]|nr:hypothetical protein [Roseivivax sp.]
MNRISIAALAAVSFLTVTAAHAAEQRVYFVGNGFFPANVYAAPGDIIRVTNMHTSNSQISVASNLALTTPDCNEINWLKDGNLDCNAGAGNNNGLTGSITLSPSSQVRFYVLLGGLVTLTGKRSSGGSFVNAAHNSTVYTDRLPTLTLPGS